MYKMVNIMTEKSSTASRKPEKTTASRKFKTKVTAKGVAPLRLKLTKHLTTERSLPRHPLPYAAKNMYYDEKWMEKQERGTTMWTIQICAAYTIIQLELRRNVSICTKI